jgi:hypothetical protein
MNTTPGYQYEPLLDPGTHIRLLQIHRCDRDAMTECTLTPWQLAEATPYHAISYTWGGPKSTTNMIINQTTMAIRQNCDDALRQAYAAKNDAFIWIDAICINQEDNEEKGLQVGIMSD